MFPIFSFLVFMILRWVGLLLWVCAHTLCVCVCITRWGTGSIGVLKWGTLQSCSVSLRQVSCQEKLGEWCVAPITPSPPPGPTEPSSFLPALTPWAVVSIWLFVCAQLLHAHSKHQANGILGDLQALKSSVKPSLWNMEPRKECAKRVTQISRDKNSLKAEGRWIQDQRNFVMKACKIYGCMCVTRTSVFHFPQPFHSPRHFPLRNVVCAHKQYTKLEGIWFIQTRTYTSKQNHFYF